MNLKAIAVSYPPVSKLSLVILTFLVSMVFFSLLSFGIAYLFFGVTPLELPSLLNDLSNEKALTVAKVTQTVSSIGVFIIPPFFLAYLFSDQVKGYLRINKRVDFLSAGFIIIAVIVAVPLINYLGELNSKMTLPAFLGGVEHWMRDAENKAAQMTDSFMKMNTPGEMIFNVFMIALLPAVGEELFFRGILQRIFIDWTKNKHWGIWITAILFSAFHMQFFGFVPRLLLGALLGYLFAWSGTLWLPIIAHFVNNAVAVVLTYIWSNDMSSINPNNFGTDVENMWPVLIGALLFTFLLFLIYLREKNEKWTGLAAVTYDVDQLENDKLVIERYEQQMVHPQVEIPQEKHVSAPKSEEKREIVQDFTPAPVALETTTNPMEKGLSNFELTDFSDQAQQEMISRMNLTYKLGSASYNSFLNQYGFIRIGRNGDAPRPTGLGLLMLGKSPQLHFPQSRIKFTIHREKEEPVIKDFEGPLVLMPGKIEEYLDLIVSTSINREQFHRVVLSEIPKKVLREVIINAIVHRDYSIEGARIMVDAFNNRVEISSPGIPKFPMKKFYDCTVPSVSRNQKISYIFNQMHLVEERGLGMKELKSLKEEGNPPDFKLENDIFITVIYRSKKLAQARPEDSPNLTEEAVIAFIKQKERIAAGEYARRFNVTTKTAQRHLNKLIEEGMLEKEGDRKGTKYFLKKQSE